MHVVVYNIMYTNFLPRVCKLWNLCILDTLGPAILSFIERLSSLRSIIISSIACGEAKCVLYRIFSIVYLNFPKTV